MPLCMCDMLLGNSWKSGRNAPILPWKSGKTLVAANANWNAMHGGIVLEHYLLGCGYTK